MNRNDPFSPTDSIYECVRCSYREATSGHRATCSECGSAVRNIAVPRE